MAADHDRRGADYVPPPRLPPAIRRPWPQNERISGANVFVTKEKGGAGRPAAGPLRKRFPSGLPRPGRREHN
jgi:hypothetical protein